MKLPTRAIVVMRTAIVSARGLAATHYGVSHQEGNGRER